MTQLTEQNKIDIIVLYHEINNQWTEMSLRLGIPESTIRSFMKRYLQTGTLNVKRGRPITITDEVRNDVVEFIESQADQTMYQLSKNFIVSQAFARKTLIDNSIAFHL